MRAQERSGLRAACWGPKQEEWRRQEPEQPSELKNKYVLWCLLLLQGKKILCSCSSPKNKGNNTQIILLFGTIELRLGQRRRDEWVSRKNDPFIGLQSSTVPRPQANTDLTVRGQGLTQEEEESKDP